SRSSWSSTVWKRLSGMVNSSLSGSLRVAAPVAASAMATSQVSTTARRCPALHRPTRCRNAATGVPSGRSGLVHGGWRCGSLPACAGLAEHPDELAVEAGHRLLGSEPADRRAPRLLDDLEDRHDGGGQRPHPEVVIGPEPLPEDADEPRLVVLPDAQPELAALRGRRRRGRRPAEEDLRADRLLTQCLGDRGQWLLLLRTAEEGLGDPLEWLGQPGGDDRLDPREVV